MYLKIKISQKATMSGITCYDCKICIFDTIYHQRNVMGSKISCQIKLFISMCLLCFIVSFHCTIIFKFHILFLCNARHAVKKAPNTKRYKGVQEKHFTFWCNSFQTCLLQTKNHTKTTFPFLLCDSLFSFTAFLVD